MPQELAKPAKKGRSAKVFGSKAHGVVANGGPLIPGNQAMRLRWPYGLMVDDEVGLQADLMAGLIKQHAG